MLVLDAPSTPGALHWRSLDPTVQLRANGVFVKEDLQPMTSWPPRSFDGWSMRNEPEGWSTEMSSPPRSRRRRLRRGTSRPRLDLDKAVLVLSEGSVELRLMEDPG